MQRSTAIAPSSVRLSHAAIVTKRILLRSRGLHLQIAYSPCFSQGKVHLEIRTALPRARASNTGGHRSVYFIR